jgi:hypothetical protein
MGQFRPFEEEVLRLLASPKIGAKAVAKILAEAELVSYEHSAVGYFLTVRHSTLPVARTVISEPIVIGCSGNVKGGYIVFIENGELMLECYSAGEEEIPETFRDQHVLVSAT